MAVIIAFEGIDGAGKSTAVQSLASELSRHRIGYQVIGSASFYEEDDDAGNDARRSEPASGRLRRRREALAIRPGPLSRCLSNAWDFAHRWESQAVPALNTGEVILADRYVYTAFVREVIRGIEEDYVRAIYRFAPEPDLTIYIDMDPEMAYQRKMDAGLDIGFFEAGRDVIRNATSLRMSFVAFQSRCRDRYKEVLANRHVVRIDGSQKAIEVNARIHQAVLPLVLPDDRRPVVKPL